MGSRVRVPAGSPSVRGDDDAGGDFAQVGAGIKAPLSDRMGREAGAGALLNGSQQLYSGMAKLTIAF